MANTILDLSGVSEAGIFTTKSHVKQDDGTWKYVDNTNDDALWYTKKELETAGIWTGTAKLAEVTDNSGVLSLAKGAGTGFDKVTTINASGSQKKWAIDDTGMSALKNITGSDKDDVFTLVKGDETIKTGGGKDSINISGITAKATITDYTYGSDVIVDTNFAVAKVGDSISSAGVIGNDSLQLTNNDGYYKVTFTKDGTAATTFNVWQGGTDAKVLDGSNETSPMIMLAGDGADTLLGGSKVDSIHASISGVYVAGGKGNDEITLEENAAGSNSRQYVAFGAETGTDAVTGFNKNVAAADIFGDTADVLVLQDGAISDIKVTTDNTHTVIKSGSGSVSLQGVDTTNAATLLMQEGTGSVSKVALIGGATYAPADSDRLVDYYISTNKKTGEVDFSNIEDDVVAELSNLGNFEDKTTFVGVDSVVGGKGNNTLIGAGETKNYLVAGAGSSTLWGGGASSDTLVGGGVADAFFIGLRDGKDTITGFDAKNEDAVDALYMLSSPATSITRDNTAAVLNFADGSSATIETNANFRTDNALRFTLDGTNFQTAKIGVSNDNNTFNYDSKVDMYFGGSKDNTLKVASDYDGKSVDIRLNNTLNQSYADIDTVNASEYEGEAFIAGNDGVSELLIGGKGKTTLWGGLGEADTLKGSSGDVTGFYFGKNNGADVITASDSDDKVVFYDFANTDLTSIDIANGKLKFTFNDSSTLEVQQFNSSAVKTFEFTNGTWAYDYDKKEFVQKA